ncbi:MAG: helix-hairpin-helix domain-containing protein [Proteobacteria bacterium]|nr:helix-hairpin-helix domain-containing protein [Desulfobacula sp.]MBU3952950.1 helix-hairpin-helix domain-containing protein [Pseudomonadota bacterium]MBU4129816.1 helix-hairpin-helix domain-containing protein [Pseudomonadota bacterium]
MKNIKRVSSIIFIGLLVILYLVPAIANTGKVNINTDDKVQLMTLKYVGEKIAEKIIEYRTTQPFEVPEDIINVKGVGQKVFDANKDRIIVKTE